MPIIFQAAPGTVVALDDPAIACGINFFSLGDDDIRFETERSIVTRLTIGQQVNLQFLHSLGSLIHIYVFGDRMGTVNLSGLSFACQCDGGPELGSEKMMLWYKRRRASRRPEPLRITLGTTVIEGFVTNFTEDVVDPSIKLVQWGVSFAALPEDD